jgi:glycosyltransferase involved in cell wall biosynthesis
VSISHVPRWGGWYFTSDVTLDRRARQVSRTLRAAGSRVLVVANGGNCRIGDINWVHSVHHAWPCRDEGAPAWFRAKNRAVKAWARRCERRGIAAASLVIANSNRTRADVIGRLGVAEERTHTVYLGSAPGWQPPDAAARERARRVWCRDATRPLIVFIGALGYDFNKGVDRVLLAWQRLCAAGWDGELVVAGAGSTAPWERLAARAARPVRFAGHTAHAGELLEAADLLVSPVRYEAYGLAAHEAVCRGVPVVLSASAGLAERLPRELDDLLLRDPEDVEALVQRIRAWAAAAPCWRERTLRAAESLRAFSEHDMAERIVELTAGAAR